MTDVEPKSVVARDFNGDGNIDLAVGTSRNKVVSILLGNGDGTFKPYQDFATSDPPDFLAVADFNGDSKLDLVTAARYAQARFSVLFGNGDGTFQAPIDTATPQTPMDLAAGDVDGDGITDMAVAVSSTIIGIFKGNGDGTFRPPLNYGAGYTVSMGDFDGNGTVDLVSGSELDSEILAGDFGIAVVPGNGDGTFQARTELLKVASTQSQTTGDLNGDGKPDIVGANYYNNTVSVYLNTGDGNFASGTDYPTGKDAIGMIAAMKSSLLCCAMILTLALGALNAVWADSATWNLHPISNDWNTSANWTPATVPNGPTDVATFASSSITDVTFSSEATEVAAIVFDPGASSFNITADPEAARINVTLTISGAGITNNSGVTQNLTAAPTVRTVAATIEFLNAASAGDNTVLTIFGSTTAARGGQINFHDTSTAGIPASSPRVRSPATRQSEAR
jgi:FG-GAP-like repeat